MHQAEFNLSLASSHSNHMSSAGICIRMLDLSKHSWVCVCDFVAIHRRILSCLLVAALPVCLYFSADLMTQRLQCSLKQAEGHRHMWTRSVWHGCLRGCARGWLNTFVCIEIVQYKNVKVWGNGCYFKCHKDASLHCFSNFIYQVFIFLLYICAASVIHVLFGSNCLSLLDHQRKKLIQVSGVSVCNIPSLDIF